MNSSLLFIIIYSARSDGPTCPVTTIIASAKVVYREVKQGRGCVYCYIHFEALDHTWLSPVKQIRVITAFSELHQDIQQAHFV